MNTPTREQWNSVIGPLKAYGHKLPKDVDMMQIGYDHSCKTPMCFAGNFMVSSGLYKESRIYGYDEGANLIAKNLGFINREELLFWAKDHPEKWGNTMGYGLFSSPKAFLPERSKEKLTTAKLIAWLEGVRDRCDPQLPVAEISNWNKTINKWPNRLEVTV